MVVSCQLNSSEDEHLHLLFSIIVLRYLTFPVRRVSSDLESLENLEISENLQMDPKIGEKSGNLEKTVKVFQNVELQTMYLTFS